MVTKQWDMPSISVEVGGLRSESSSADMAATFFSVLADGPREAEGLPGASLTEVLYDLCTFNFLT